MTEFSVPFHAFCKEKRPLLSESVSIHLVVSDNVFTGEGLSTEEREQGFDQMIILALETVLKL